LYAHAGLWKVEKGSDCCAKEHRDALHMLYLQPMNLAYDYHPWGFPGAVDNTLFLDAHAGLWKVEDFLYRAEIAVPRSIEMLCTCVTCNQGTWPLIIIHGVLLELSTTLLTWMLMLVSGKLRTFSIGSAKEHRDAFHMLYLQPRSLVSDYHPWGFPEAVDQVSPELLCLYVYGLGFISVLTLHHARILDYLTQCFIQRVYQPYG
jgi:hypothetical protein